MSANPDDQETGFVPHKKDRLAEVLVFLFLIVPSMALSFFASKQGAALSFVTIAIATILRDLALVFLILVFLSKNQESSRRIGWRFGDAAREVALGILLYIPFFFATNLIESILLASGLHEPSVPSAELEATGGLSHVLLGLGLVIVVAFSEETIFRGYLIRRFLDLSLGAAAAVTLSTVVFALGHGYEGSAGVATVGFMGLIFALIYLWRGSLIAPMVMHFLQDFIGIVLLPLIAGK